MINPNDETTRAIVATAERFADRELKEGAEERDRYPYGPFAEKVIAAAAEAGLLALTLPEEVGGIALPPEGWALVLEPVAYADAGIATVLLAHGMAAEAVVRYGAAKIKEKMLSQAAHEVWAYPLYLQADDPPELPAAEKAGEGYLLSGRARLVANAPAAEAAVVWAELDGGEVGLFLVPLPPELRPAPVEVLGLRSCPVSHLDLPDLFLPAEHLLVKGREALAELHHLFLPAASALLIALLQSSLDYAVEYGKERYQGGKMIVEHSQLRMMYGRMAAEHETLRQALVAVIQNGGGPARVALKVMAAELAVRAAMDGVQLLGGYGYIMDYPQERKMRDARQAAELLGSPARLRLTLVEGMGG